MVILMANEIRERFRERKYSYKNKRKKILTRNKSYDIIKTKQNDTIKKQKNRRKEYE